MSNSSLLPFVLATRIAGPLQSQLNPRFADVMRDICGLVAGFLSQSVTPETTAEFEKNWLSFSEGSDETSPKWHTMPLSRMSRSPDRAAWNSTMLSFSDADTRRRRATESARCSGRSHSGDLHTNP